MNVLIRFFNPNDTIDYSPERPGEDRTEGPFDVTTIQATYSELRVGEAGDVVAFYDTERGQWRIAGDPAPNDGQWHEIHERLSVGGYSDWELSEVTA